MNNAKISVVTVCFNAVDSIEKTVLSVINQDYDNVEYIIIDGGSTDGTVDIIKKYDDRISFWISEPDKGVYDAMNKALDHATGNYVYFLGANDILHPNILSNIFETNYPYNYILYGNVRFLPTEQIYNGRFDFLKIMFHNISHQSIFYPLMAFKNLRYPLKYPIYADHFVNIVLWGQKRWKFHYIDFVIADFQLGGLSSTCNDRDFKNDKPKIFIKYLGLIPYIIFCITSALREIRHRTKDILKKIFNEYISG